MMAAPSASFDPDFAGPAQWAEMYRAEGLNVVPAYAPGEAGGGASWKRPCVKTWREFTDAAIPEFNFQRWWGATGDHVKRPQMGVITGPGSGNVFVVDLDEHKSPAARQWWSDLLASHNDGAEPLTWQQRTGGGGRQMCFRAPADWHAPTNKTAIGVDIRGRGGFAMLPPSKHESGQEYAWAPGYAPWQADILDAPEWLLEAVERLVVEHGGTPGQSGVERTGTPDFEHDAWGNQIDGREEKMRDVVWAVVVDWWRECPIVPSEAEQRAKAEEAYVAYERAVGARLKGADKTALLEREGRGPTEFWRKWQAAMRQWDTKVAEDAKKPRHGATEATPPSEDPGEPVPPPEGFHAQPFRYVDPSTIPPREWIYGRHLIRRFISTTVAPGGVGKSSLTIVEQLAVVTGRPLLGVQPDESCPCLYWNGEDPMDELDRRIMAAVLHYGIRPEELAGRFFVNSGRLTPIVIAEKTRDGLTIHAPIIDQVIATIRANKIGVMTVDPFVACHRVTENDNSEIERVAKSWSHIADATGCAIELVHHVRKMNGNEVTVEDGRGAVALLSAARAARAINRMSADEAAKAGVQEPQFYFRLDNGKANLAPPTGVQWFHMASVDLHNGTQATESAPERPSDKVGVVEAWAWPDHSEGVTGSDVEEVQRRLRGSSTRYRADAQSPDWIGKLIIDVLGADPTAATSVAQAKHLQKVWTGTGALREFQADDERRRKKTFVEAGN